MSNALVHQPAGVAELSEHQWQALERRAEKLARVSYVPDAFRGKPNDIMAVGLALAALGKPLTPLTLKMCYVVKGTVDYLFQLYAALVHEHGHEMWVVEESDTAATVAGQRAGSERVHTVTFTIDDAKKANLAGKDVWKQYTRDMLVARAGKRVAKRIAPEAILGLPPPPVVAPGPEGRPVVVEGQADDEDVVDAELVEEQPTGHATAAPPGPVTTTVNAGPHRDHPLPVTQERRVALRRAIEALDEEEMRLVWPLARQRQVPSLDGPHLMHPDALALEACIRQARALVACQRVGVTSDEGRHKLIREATEGQRTSSQNLTDDELAAVLAYCDALASAEA